jgi:hypothetical protein
MDFRKERNHLVRQKEVKTDEEIKKGNDFIVQFLMELSIRHRWISPFEKPYLVPMVDHGQLQ